MSHTHTHTVEELEAALLAATDPTTYDTIEARLKEARRAVSIEAAQRGANAAAAAALARQVRITEHNQRRAELAGIPERMQKLDEDIFSQLAYLHELIGDRYTLAKHSKSLAQSLHNEAKELGQSTPATIEDPTAFPDASSLQTYASDIVKRFEENSRVAAAVGVPFTLATLRVPSYDVERVAKSLPKDEPGSRTKPAKNAD